MSEASSSDHTHPLAGGVSVRRQRHMHAPLRPIGKRCVDPPCLRSSGSATCGRACGPLLLGCCAGITAPIVISPITLQA